MFEATKLHPTKETLFKPGIFRIKYRVFKIIMCSFIYPFIHSKVSIDYVLGPGTVLGTVDTLMSRTEIVSPFVNSAFWSGNKYDKHNQ